MTAVELFSEQGYDATTVEQIATRAGKAAIDSSVELPERAALKNVGLAAAMTTAPLEREVAEPLAQLASELGELALKRGYAAWSEGGREAGDDLASHALAALKELQAASAAL